MSLKLRILGCLLLALAPRAAAAHPTDEMVQGAYITLAPGEVRLELDLTAGTEVAGVVLRAMDLNGDRRITQAEADAYAQRVLGQSTLTLDGAAAPWRLTKVVAPPYESILLGADTVKIYAVALRADRAGPVTLAYENRYQPASSQWTANVFLQPGPGWRYRIVAQKRSTDGRRLTVSYTGAR